ILALSHWVLSTTSANPSKHIRWLITYATIASVIFRFEVVLTLGPILLYTSRIHRIGFTEVAVGASVGLASLVTSLVIDSYFWQRPWMWPEGSVFYFNAILGKSVEWGVSPFHTYFTVFIPKLLVASLPLSIFALIVDERTRLYISPIIIFVAGFSLLGHKEWRFIVYVVPVFNLCAAIGWSWIEQKASKLYRIVRYIIIVALIMSFISSTGILIISSYNYPGGAALLKLHNIEKNYIRETDPYLPRSARVHLDVYTAMTGASRFGELRKDWIYSKEESHFTPEDYSNYTHILTHTPLFHEDRFIVVDIVYGYEKVKRKSVKEVIETLGDITTGKADGEKIKMNYDGFKVFAAGLIDTAFRLFPIEIVIEPKVWIMKSKTA
ncbi:7760_t:CDS:2, partial [Paraglomus occultum]